MTDSINDTSKSLWILIITLFVITAVITILATFHGIFSSYFGFCIPYRPSSRYCCCYCCTLDLEGYQRERDSLRRLRDLRQIHLLHQRLELQTYSQIPGPVPHTLHRSTIGGPSSLLHTYEAFGFIFVPTTTERSEGTILSWRDQLTAEQRRTILEQLMVCHEYHKEISHLSRDQPIEKTTVKDETVTIKNGTIAVTKSMLVTPEANLSNLPASVSTQDTLTDTMSPSTKDMALSIQVPLPVVETVQSDEEMGVDIVFPSHEEPDGAACAICLDHFQEGEAINSPARCPHVFHKDCLMAWLEKHDVCPCCRRSMITESQWREAVESNGVLSSLTSVTFGTTTFP